MDSDLTALRHDLHRFPELSGNERLTSARIIAFLKPLKPDLILSKVGGYGVLAVFSGQAAGQDVLFRADMDALPITEINTMPYRSEHPGVAHKCGHDGHSAILAGLAATIAERRPEKGRYLLLFQPSEETGKGAAAVLSDPAFSAFNPGFCFALHNLPGYARNKVIVRNGTFAAASRGMIIRLKGRTSHASEPEKGLSPAAVMARLMAALPRLSGNGDGPEYREFVLLTLIYASLGTPAFGTSPGEAVLMATLRAYLDSDMEKLTQNAERLVMEFAAPSKLNYEISYTEEFPATTNHPEAVKIVLGAAAASGLEVVEAGLPFRWSEDFAHFGRISKATLFGIGAGTTHPPLHDAGYDFPDRIIPVGVSVLKEIYTRFAFNTP